MFVQHQPIQFHSSETMTERFQQDSGEERVTAKSRPMMSPIAKRSVERIILDFSWLGEEKSWKSKSVQLPKKRKDRGDPISAATERLHSTTIIMNNSWKVSSQQVIQSGMMTMLDLLKSGKLILRRTSDWDDLMKLLGERHENPNQISLTRKLSMMEPRNPL